MASFYFQARRYPVTSSMGQAQRRRPRQLLPRDPQFVRVPRPQSLPDSAGPRSTRVRRASRLKPNTSKLLGGRFASADFGTGTAPSWMCQRSTTWPGVTRGRDDRLVCDRMLAGERTQLSVTMPSVRLNSRRRRCANSTLRSASSPKAESARPPASGRRRAGGRRGLQAHGAPPPGVLRWHIQLGAVPVPKSADAKRQAENFDVFGFTLTHAELASISALESGRLWGGDPETNEEFSRAGAVAPAGTQA